MNSLSQSTDEYINSFMVHFPIIGLPDFLSGLTTISVAFSMATGAAFPKARTAVKRKYELNSFQHGAAHQTGAVTVCLPAR